MVLLTYKKYLGGLGSPDGTLAIASALKFDTDKSYYVKVVNASISSQIPNIYNYGGLNNGMMGASNDNGATWTTFQLTDGIYSLDEIQQGFYSAMASIGWIANGATVPPVQFKYNPVTLQSYLILTSASLASGLQLKVNLAYNGSLLYQLLGFTTSSALLTTDGIKSSNSVAQLDWNSNQISLQVQGLGVLSIVNGVHSSEICRINMSYAGTVPTLYIYPYLDKSPKIEIQPVGSLSQLTYQFRSGTNNDRPIYILEGEVSVILEINEVGYGK